MTKEDIEELRESFKNQDTVYQDELDELCNLAIKGLAAVPEAGQTGQQEPVAWRWRNRGGQWWYSETPPLNGSNHIDVDAQIEPLYRPRDLDTQPIPQRD